MVPGATGRDTRRLRARLKVALVCLASAALGPLAAAPARAGNENCPAAFGDPVVVRDVDGFGDLLLADGRVVRLAAVTVASGEAGDVSAFRAMLARASVGREVVVASAAPDADRYGRIAGMVRLAQDEGATRPGLQERALREGVAVALPEAGYLGCMAGFFLEEWPARAAKRGLWARLPVNAHDPDAVRAQIGRFTILAGRIAGVGNGRAVDYLNFGRVWRKDTTLRLTAESRSALEQAGVVVGALAGHPVTARGVVFEAGGPAIDIRWVEQLEH